jgi:hypothetical protein
MQYLIDIFITKSPTAIEQLPDCTATGSLLPETGTIQAGLYDRLGIYNRTALQQIVNRLYSRKFSVRWCLANAAVLFVN